MSPETSSDCCSFLSSITSSVEPGSTRVTPCVGTSRPAACFSAKRLFTSIARTPPVNRTIIIVITSETVTALRLEKGTDLIAAAELTDCGETGVTGLLAVVGFCPSLLTSSVSNG